MLSTHLRNNVLADLLPRRRDAGSELDELLNALRDDADADQIKAVTLATIQRLYRSPVWRKSARFMLLLDAYGRDSDTAEIMDATNTYMERSTGLPITLWVNVYLGRTTLGRARATAAGELHKLTG